jgi:Skp family chaperone for outer membrane proteins
MLKNIVTVSALTAGLVFSAASFAAGSEKIGVVDMKTILTSAPQMKAINAKLKTQFSKRKETILSQAKTLQADMSNYQKNKAVLSASKANTLKSKIGSEENQLRTEQMRYQQDLMAAQNKAMASFLNRLKFSVTKVANKKGLTVVLPKNNLLYASDNIDITSSVLDSLK